MFYQITKTKPKWRQVCHPNLHVTLHYNFHAINFQKVHIYYLLYLEIFMNYLFFTDGSMSFSSSRSSRLSTFSSLTTMESTSLTSNTTSPTMTNRSNVSAEKSNGSPSKVRTIRNFHKNSTFFKILLFQVSQNSIEENPPRLSPRDENGISPPPIPPKKQLHESGL